MTHRFVFLGAVLVLPGAVGLWLVACGGQGGGNSLDIADKDKQAYRMDCETYCQSAPDCSGQEYAACVESCAQTVDAGALQSAYIDSLYDCVIGLDAPCNEADLDACIGQAQQQCVRAANLDAFISDYCDRFHICGAYDPDQWRSKCINDMEESAQIDLLACTSAAGVEKLDQCVTDAACQQVESTAVIDLCMEIYR